jgi:hypothetical protein
MGFLPTAPTGEILGANPESCRLLGRTEEEVCRVGKGESLTQQILDCQLRLMSGPVRADGGVSSPGCAETALASQRRYRQGCSGTEPAIFGPAWSFTISPSESRLFNFTPHHARQALAFATIDAGTRRTLKRHLLDREQPRSGRHRESTVSERRNTGAEVIRPRIRFRARAPDEELRQYGHM